MGPWIAIVFWERNNGQVSMLCEDEDGMWAGRFESPEEIHSLRAQHALKCFPWIAVNVETGETEYLL